MTTETIEMPRNETLAEFRNEPLTDFSKSQNRTMMEAALQKVRSEFGREHPLIVGGEHITGLRTFDSLNPSHKGQVLGKFQKATAAHAQQAIDAAWKAFESWKHAPVSTRAGLLLRAAELMRKRKHEFSAK